MPMNLRLGAALAVSGGLILLVTSGCCPCPRATLGPSTPAPGLQAFRVLSAMAQAIEANPENCAALATALGQRGREFEELMACVPEGATPMGFKMGMQRIAAAVQKGGKCFTHPAVKQALGTILGDLLGSQGPPQRRAAPRPRHTMDRSEGYEDQTQSGPPTAEDVVINKIIDQRKVRLGQCQLEAKASSLRIRVEIRGSGDLIAVTAQPESATGCVRKALEGLRFPSFKASVTHASYVLSL